MCWRRSAAGSAAISSASAISCRAATGGSTLLTSIVSLDPIYIYFDMDEATYLKNNRL